MKLLAILFILVSFGAEACNQANRTCINQRNSANNNTTAVSIPNQGSDAVYYFEQGSLTPKLATLGANCSITAGVLNCAANYRVVVPTTASQIDVVAYYK